MPAKAPNIPQQKFCQAVFGVLILDLESKHRASVYTAHLIDVGENASITSGGIVLREKALRAGHLHD